MKKFIKLNKKRTIRILILLMIGFVLIPTCIAYLKKENNKTNEFIIGNVKSEIIEDFDVENNVKKSVSVKNIGNVPSYIRVAILFNFKDNNGDIIGEVPIRNDDYIIDFSSSDNWKLMNDGYYYYKYPVASNELTDVLINECRPLKKYDDRTFMVDIIVQEIQANPPKAVVESWNVSIKDNKILFDN